MWVSHSEIHQTTCNSHALLQEISVTPPSTSLNMLRIQRIEILTDCSLDLEIRFIVFSNRCFSSPSPVSFFKLLTLISLHSNRSSCCCCCCCFSFSFLVKLLGKFQMGGMWGGSYSDPRVDFKVKTFEVKEVQKTS